MQTGICPVCNGTGRCPAGNDPYKTSYARYDAATDTLPCRNCGGQTMHGQGTGQVLLNKDGVPCTHKYTGRELGRCYWGYTCKHCGDYYTIDSGD
jgi:hypothetical protein